MAHARYTSAEIAQRDYRIPIAGTRAGIVVSPVEINGVRQAVGLNQNAVQRGRAGGDRRRALTVVDDQGRRDQIHDGPPVK